MKQLRLRVIAAAVAFGSLIAGPVNAQWRIALPHGMTEAPAQAAPAGPGPSGPARVGQVQGMVHPLPPGMSNRPAVLDGQSPAGLTRGRGESGNAFPRGLSRGRAGLDKALAPGMSKGQGAKSPAPPGLSPNR